jgi:aspartate carbamoyltransferase regulatory subunit
MPPALTTSRQSLLSHTNTLAATHPSRYVTSSYLTSDEVKPHSSLPSPSHSCINYSSTKSCELNTQVSHSAQNTMIIFDWDDTLLPSSFLGHRRCHLDSDFKNIPYGNEIRAELDQLDMVVSSLLQLASKYGSVHIITNAEHGWVQMSAAKFLPITSKLLSSITIQSARTAYESSFPDSPMKWKMSSFSDHIHSFLSPKVDLHSEKHIISLGDSQLERQAVRTTTRGHAHHNLRTKSIKLSENPSIEQLIKQMELVSQCFNYICTHNADLDLQMSVATTSHTRYRTEYCHSPHSHSYHTKQLTPPAESTTWPKDFSSNDYFSEDDSDDMDACGEIGAEYGDDNSMFDGIYSSVQSVA